MQAFGSRSRQTARTRRQPRPTGWRERRMRAIAAREENMATTVIGRPLGRRAMLAVTGAALTMPFIARRSLAEAKPFRISTPGPPEEWQSKSLELFKKELDAAMPGQFDVQIHYNGTLFAQGTEIEAMQ